MPSFFERGYTDGSMLRRVVQFTTEKIGALYYVQKAQLSVQLIQLLFA